MFKSKLLIVILGVISVATIAWGAKSDEAEIEKLYQEYWTASKEGNYKIASEFLYPPDLNALHAGLLPALLSASKSPKPEIRALVDFLSDGLPLERRAELTPLKLYEKISEMAIRGNPQVAELVKRSSIKVDKIKLSKNDEATMRYSMKVDGESADDSANFSKFQGRWYLRLDDPPQETVQEFKLHLGQ